MGPANASSSAPQVRAVSLATLINALGIEKARNSLGAPDELKRSEYLLKHKIKEDAACIVREYILGDGKLTGLLGSLKCEILMDSKPTGIFQQIGTGFTDSQRENYMIKDHPEYIPIGSVISFSYMDMTKDGDDQDSPRVILKLDCEGCEWGFIFSSDWDPSVREVVGELHFVPEVNVSLWCRAHETFLSRFLSRPELCNYLRFCLQEEGVRAMNRRLCVPHDDPIFGYGGWSYGERTSKSSFT
jgi:hypothetical protein